MSKLGFWDRFKFNVAAGIHALFRGMKNADVVMTTNQKAFDNSGVEIPDEGGGGGVYKDILDQKVTQEVEEMRYFSYKIADESKKYRYVGNGKGAKKTQSQLSAKHTKVDESDGYPIILIQDNFLVCDDVYTVMNEVGKTTGKKVLSDFHIKIKRDFLPRFFAEQYIKKVVVKQFDETRYILDFYYSVYPRQYNEKMDRSFISEIEKIISQQRKSDVFDFQEVSFVTRNAWGSEDRRLYSFTDCELLDIVKFDGNYVLKTLCSGSIINKNLLDKVYSESAERKCQTKAPRKNAVIELVSSTDQEEYVAPDKNELEKLKTLQFSVDNNSSNE